MLQRYSSCACVCLLISLLTGSHGFLLAGGRQIIAVNRGAHAYKSIFRSARIPPLQSLRMAEVDQETESFRAIYILTVTSF